jgi:hypothetical protein
MHVRLVITVVVCFAASAVFAEERLPPPTGDAQKDAATATALVQKAKVVLKAAVPKISITSVTTSWQKDVAAAVTSLDHATLISEKEAEACTDAHVSYRGALAFQGQYVFQQGTALYFEWVISQAQSMATFECEGPGVGYTAFQMKRFQARCTKYKNAAAESKKTNQPLADVAFKQAKGAWAEAMKLYKEAAKQCPEHFSDLVPSGPPQVL